MYFFGTRGAPLRKKIGGAALNWSNPHYKDMFCMLKSPAQTQDNNIYLYNFIYIYIYTINSHKNKFKLKINKKRLEGA